MLAAALGLAQTGIAQERNIPQANSSYIDANGTAHLTRVVPVPATISPEAQRSLGRQISDARGDQSIADRRSQTDAWQTRPVMLHARFFL